MFKEETEKPRSRRSIRKINSEKHKLIRNLTCGCKHTTTKPKIISGNKAYY
jgi:hypothetical protein